MPGAMRKGAVGDKSPELKPEGGHDPDGFDEQVGAGLCLLLWQVSVSVRRSGCLKFQVCVCSCAANSPHAMSWHRCLKHEGGLLLCWQLRCHSMWRVLADYSSPADA